MDWLIGGVLLNFLFGELPNSFHPVVYIGNIIKFIEQKMYKDNFVNGIKFFIVVQSCVLCIFICLYFFSKILNILWIFKIFVAYTMISIGGMREHVFKVRDAFFKNLKAVKNEVRRIVSRDVENMNDEKLITSTIESVGENFVDAFLSPFLYGLVFGWVGVIIYRVSNVLDAMVGYKNSKYLNFGKFSAVVDDCLNYIPARLQVLPVVVSAQVLFGTGRSAYMCFFRFRKALQSPNSGCGISLFAGALKVKLGGVTYYDGKPMQKPVIYGGDDKITVELLNKAIWLYIHSALFVISFFFFYELIIKL